MIASLARPSGARVNPRARCPDEALHAVGQPDGYFARRAWANGMLRTHVQTRCPGCGLWRVWRPYLAAGRDLRSRPAQERAAEDRVEAMAALPWPMPAVLVVVADQDGRVAAWLEDAA